MMLTPTPAAAPAAPNPARVTWAGHASRVLVIGLVLVAGFVLLDFYRALFTDPATADPPPPDAAAGTDLRELFLAEGAWSFGEKDWVINQADVSAGPNPPPAPLLPVPAGAAVMARRWGGGRVVAELVGPVAGDQPVPAAWAEAGWATRPLAPGGPGDGFLVRRGGDTMQVWRFNPPGGPGCFLVIRP